MRSITGNHFICFLLTMIFTLNAMIILNSCTDNSDPEKQNPVWYRPVPPIAETYPVVFVTQSRAVLEGFVNTWGNTTKVRFDYGSTMSYEYSMPGPMMNTPPTGNVSDTLSRLNQGTTFHYRLTATNKYGTTNGNDVSFTTLKAGESGIIFNPDLTYSTLTDIDGNTYKIIQIGTQTWMAENLKTSRLNDSVSMTNVSDKKIWLTLTTPAYGWYSNDSAAFKVSNGALYNWYAVNTGKLCPAGWHVPMKKEWIKLIDYLGGNDQALGKLQETGAAHWRWQNPEATNSSGFTALPCGGLLGDYNFNNFNFLGTGGWWYSSTQDDLLLTVSTMHVYFDYAMISPLVSSASKNCGMSIRCIKD